MTLFCRADISIALPRPLLWDLITDPAARQLWQPDVQSATIEAGYGGGKGSVITLEAGRNKRSVSVTERVIRVRQQESLVVLQSWPKHELQKKYIVLRNQPTPRYSPCKCAIASKSLLGFLASK